jgi:hypothetical protein
MVPGAAWYHCATNNPNAWERKQRIVKGAKNPNSKNITNARQFAADQSWLSSLVYPVVLSTQLTFLFLQIVS